MERTSKWARLCTWAVLVAMATIAVLPAGSMAQSAPSSDPALAAAAVNTPQIILIDASNKIEVLGVSGTTIANPALWVSPTGYWSNLATGDFNHDGDQEIIATGYNTSAGQGVMSIFDPVLSSPQPATLNVALGSGQSFRSVVTGNFEGLASGQDQIVVSYNYTANNRTWEDVFEYYPTNASATAWGVRQIGHWGDVWDQMAAGDLNNDGRAELVLGRNIDNRLLVLAGQNGNWSTVFEQAGYCCSWKSFTIGRVVTSRANNQLIINRNVPAAGNRTPSTLVFSWNAAQNTFDDLTPQPSTSTSPSPYFFYPNFADMALANLDGTTSNYREMINLRPLPNDPIYANIPFMAELNLTGVSLPAFEPVGDYGNNSWLQVAAGDLDGNGRDEVVVLRANMLRIYNQPWVNTSHWADVNGSFRTSNLTIANTGFSSGPIMSVTPTPLNFEAPKNSQVPPKTVSVFNSTTTQSFNWTAQVTNGANWISLSKSSGTASNVADTFQVTVNAVTVPNLGNNIGTIQVSTTAPFVNSVQNVVVNFNVLPDAGPVVAPESLTLFAKINSTATGQISIQRPATSPVTWTSVAVPLGVAAQLPAKLADGSAQLTPGGLVVDGALVAQPDWLTYNPTGGTTGATPTLIQVTVNPAAPSVNNVVGTYRAAIVIIPTNPYSPDWVRSVEVKMIVANQVYHLALPRVGR